MNGTHSWSLASTGYIPYGVAAHRAFIPPHVSNVVALAVVMYTGGCVCFFHRVIWGHTYCKVCPRLLYSSRGSNPFI